MKSVLVATDDRLLGTAINKVLSSAGFTVLEADTVDQARHVLTSMEIACIVSTSSLELHRFLMEQWTTYRTVTLLRKTNTASFDEIYSPPHHEYETIPLDPEYLLYLVNKVIDA